MTPILTGQLILGIDKRNPLFTVYAQEDDDQQEQLHVYYGLELLEVVPAERNDPNFKMLVGRLHNAGVSLRALEQSFGRDGKTIRRWGRALRCRNAQELVRVLAGRQTARKLTPEITAYVRARWPEVSGAGTYGTSKRLRQEIKTVFHVAISEETLRPLVGSLKRQGPPARLSSALTEPGASEGFAPAPNPTDAQALGPEAAEKPGEGSAAQPASAVEPTTPEGLPESDQSVIEAEELSPAAGEKAWGCSLARPASQPPAGSVPAAPAGTLPGPPQTLWCDHAGVLVFAPVLLAVAQVIEPAQALFKQWLASLLLGALNIEQTKFLNWQDLTRLLGTVVRFAHPQRQELERVAIPANVEALARFNARQLGADTQSDFYFDPHTKHYTGQENVLEGWCPAIRWADKAMHSDFIHTAVGEPLYFETTDNFTDVRQRFFGVLQRCRQVLQWPAERVLTLVVDRAIFGQEVFERVLGDPTLHLITWEKGYQAQSWPPPGGLSGSMVIERPRNRAEDLRSYHLEYWDRPWPKEPRLRQLVVQATNPKGLTIQVSILTDDSQRAAVDIIGLIFCRWVQENDFKYLDKHFGINQITSYGVTDYEELRGQVEDRQVRSAEAKALQEQRRQLRGQQSRLLLLQAKGEHAAASCHKRIEELEQQPPAPEAKKQLAGLRQRQTRWQRTRCARQTQIDTLSRELAELEVKARTAQQTESRLERMIAEKMVRLDPEKKRLMDSLRVIARNVFYAALQPFKQAYNNYRDDHEQFRQLTQASGVLEVRPEQIVVHLMPRVNYSPQLRRLLAGVLEAINAQRPVLPDGSGRPLKLRLGSRSELTLSIQPRS